MTRARWRVIIMLVAVGMAALAAALTIGRERVVPDRDKPVLLLLTSLPVVFGEDFSIDSSGSPLLTALERHYRVRPIATSSARELAQGRLLLMAQPLAQPAEDLVALDEWVRGGGRVLLLADPMLEWPDSRPLGDATRPPPMFMDTGLLMRWGLQLSTPTGRGERKRRLAGEEVVAVSPGELSGNCVVAKGRLTAECTIGLGRATVVADADFIDWRRGSDGATGERALIAALARLERA